MGEESQERNCADVINKHKNSVVYHAAVISTKRPHRVIPMTGVLGEVAATWYVTAGEEEAYVAAGVPRGSVVGCEPNISAARNAAIADARAHGACSIQTSDDLRAVRRLWMAGTTRKNERIAFLDAVGWLLATAEKTSRVYGGVAVTNNPLNYKGVDVSFDKFVACDLIYVSPRCPLFDTNMALKEDYDMTLEVVLNHGGVFRCDNILCDFPHRENKGGANTYRNSRTEDAVTARMFAKWGCLIEKHRTRDGQISLRKNAIQQEVAFRRKKITK